MKRSRRWMIGLPLLGLASVMLVLSVRWGMASLQLQAAALNGAALSAPGELGLAQRELLDRALAQLDRAESLRGPHPEQSNLRARLLEWELASVVLAPETRKARQDEILRLYRDAIRQRPSWPYFWANLAFAHARMGHFEKEFQHALERTVSLGPWERTLQLQLVRLDFMYGARLDAGSRAQLDGVLQRAARVQAARLWSLAGTPNERARVCEVLVEAYQAACAPYRPGG
jgi:tetratricopeptide (TPR) repeat protein